MYEKNQLGDTRQLIRNKRNIAKSMLDVKSLVNVANGIRKNMRFEKTHGNHVYFNLNNSKLEKALRYMEWNPLLEKHKKISYSDIRLDFMRVDVEFANINLAIAEFTNKNRKLMASICKKYLLNVEFDKDNRYLRLKDADKNYISKEQMRMIAEDNQIDVAFGIKDKFDSVS